MYSARIWSTYSMKRMCNCTYPYSMCIYKLQNRQCKPLQLQFWFRLARTVYSNLSLHFSFTIINESCVTSTQFESLQYVLCITVCIFFPGKSLLSLQFLEVKTWLRKERRQAISESLSAMEKNVYISTCVGWLLKCQSILESPTCFAFNYKFSWIMKC